MTTNTNRRRFLKATGMMVGGALAARGALRAESQPAPETYATHAKGIRILPGEWRPHYPWEHIAWVSPSWPSQDYLWLDFPEAIFSSQGLLFLSHVNPPFPTVFENLPKIPWEPLPDGVRFDRTLPNGIEFGGTVRKGSETTVDLELRLKNGSTEPLENITLQTCAFLRGIKEFAEYTRDNKFIHTPKAGWISMEAAREMKGGSEKFRVGWRDRGEPISDLPVMVTRSNEADRYVAMTWFTDTLSMVSNPHHPCMHADPKFPNLSPGEEAKIQGKLIFFEGPLEAFDFEKYIPVD